MRRLIPAFVKPAIRFAYYKQQRAKVFRERAIRRRQNELIRRLDPSSRKLIVFLVEGADWDTGTDKISGGIISIVSLCEESKKLRSIHNSEVIMCTMPGFHLLQQHTSFRNETPVFRFDQLQGHFKEARELILHIPEYLCERLLENIFSDDFEWLSRLHRVQLNIMNQNIRLMPSLAVIDGLRQEVSELTITTAHQQYCTAHYRELYHSPLHKLSVWISPEKYFFKSYADKQPLVIISPDDHPAKAAVMEKLSAVPGLKLQVIRNLTYEQYKETISRAKWAITFGEGLDGYFIEPIFSGAIAFAVYNQEFFTKDFSGLRTTYASAGEMTDKIIGDMQQLDEACAFGKYQKTLFDICAAHYSHEQYVNNIIAFYNGNYTFR